MIVEVANYNHHRTTILIIYVRYQCRTVGYGTLDRQLNMYGAPEDSWTC